MSNIELTEDEKDCLQELMNVAYGSATAAITEIFDAFAKLSIPTIQIINAVDLKDYLAKELNFKDYLALGEGELVIVYAKDKKDDEKEEEKIMPIFEIGEKGPHKPFIHKGKTTPPKHYTEATLLRGMETAGRQVDDEEMRELMKENGIGRPSTRANIIETLFRRKYIEKKKRNIINNIGVDNINSIQKQNDITNISINFRDEGY